ncbi:MAG: TraR/DksA family transcriptional regulator [Fimbriiglobus sp.]
MARNDALLRITKTLVARRAELRKRLGGDLAELGGQAPSGDPADAAFDHTGEELASQLAVLESRELSHVEIALYRIKQGKYGTCAGCGSRIPVARLSALPYSTLCISCQKEAEDDDSLSPDDRLQADWDKIRDEAGDRDFNLADLAVDVSK